MVSKVAAENPKYCGNSFDWILPKVCRETVWKRSLGDKRMTQTVDPNQPAKLKKCKERKYAIGTVVYFDAIHKVPNTPTDLTYKNTSARTNTVMSSPTQGLLTKEGVTTSPMTSSFISVVFAGHR